MVGRDEPRLMGRRYLKKNANRNLHGRGRRAQAKVVRVGVPPMASKMYRVVVTTEE
jgi:hypothetical protein